MNVFISWSGEKSLQVAKELRNWLPNVVQASEPWVSDSDIEVGKPWRDELDKHLIQSHIGIFCITSENQEKPWLMFEAGYLSNVDKVSRIIPVLIDIGKNDLTKNGPLGSLQVVECCHDDFKKLIKAICHDAEIASTKQIFKAFKKSWPKFQEKVNEILSDRNNTELKRTSAEITWNTLNDEGYDKLMQIYFGAVRDRISLACQQALKRYQENKKANRNEDLHLIKQRIRQCRHNLAPFRYQDPESVT